MVNPALTGAFGYTAEQLVGTSWRALVRSDEGGRETEVRLLDRAGQTRFAVVTTEAIPGTDLTIVVFNETTRRRLAEDGLRRSEQRYRVLAETSPLAVGATDRDMTWTYVSPRLAEVHGFDRAERLVGTSAMDLIHPDERGRLAERVRRQLDRDGVARGIEARCLRRDGTAFPAELNIALVRDEQGNPVTAIAVLRDLTQQRETLDRLRETEQRYRTLFDLSPDGIAVHQNGRVVLVNKAGAALLGYEDPDQLVGLPVMDIVHPDDRARAAQRITAAVQQGRPALLAEERFRRRDGSFFPVEVVNSPMLWQGWPAVLVVVRDISARKQLLAKIEETAAQLRAIIGNAPEGIAAELDGRIAYANERFAGLYGYYPAEVTGKPIAELVAEPDRARIAEYTGKRLGGGDAPHGYTFTGLRKDGSTVRLAITVSTYELHGKTYTLGFLREA
jgi:PAS domain S-box-containing protein